MLTKAPDTDTIASGLFVVALLLGVVTLGLWLARLPAFAFKKIHIQGTLKEVDPAYLERIAKKEMNGTYFTLNLHQARAAFEQDPWVERASVRRVWPRALEVKIEERTPLATWNETQLLSDKGTLFAAITQQALPQVQAPEVLAGEVFKRLTQWQGAVSSLKLQIVSVHVSERRAWQIRLNNGVVAQLGRDNVDERFARFAQYLRRIEGGGNNAQFDMRYRDGFSVRYGAEKRGEGA